MRITVIGVGKVKERYFTGAIEEYGKRLGRFCRLEIVEVADEKTPEGASEAQKVQIREKEGERILKKLPAGAYVVALAIDGKMFNSEELSEQMERWKVGGISHAAFVIGGSLGLSEEVLSRADFRLSFSRMTFPHQLMRVILLEQIYRSFMIQSGAPYHK
ncbi:MAG: 23S rRNA (pseudouridine(1915)-N(3))-methyltransferase RlmH [Lachnospiraceae bacterium]|nr:23S rRNA (pseudouridine(1915)-N(3))-methyltransferase RlmH [Lachnospiraceae bacterium]